LLFHTVRGTLNFIRASFIIGQSLFHSKAKQPRFGVCRTLQSCILFPQLVESGH
jgi:hypothetical protein